MLINKEICFEEVIFDEEMTIKYSLAMEQDKHYYAFISHSSNDEKIAFWLRNQLVNYNIPVSVQKEFNAPKRLRPVFVYQTDLAGNVLGDALGKELHDSQYLIAICSPLGAKSDYVNNEVQHFIDAGKVDKIIPFIVDGKPHADNPDEECFPRALQKAPMELRGINLKELTKQLGSKRGAVVNVIATMLGVRFDALWDIYKRKQRRKRILFSCLAMLMTCLVLFVWDYKRPTYKYFVDYVDCWGVPEGIMELSKEQVSGRSGSYQFEYRRVSFGEPDAYSWRVAKVSYVNSSLQPKDIGNTELKDRYPVQELEYNKDLGVVKRINYCDINGKVLLRHELSERDGISAAIADFRNAQEQLGSGFVGASLSSMKMGQMDAGQRKANIVRYAYERDAQGHIVKQTYHANNDYSLVRSAVSDGDGIFGCLYTLDSLGRRIKVEYLGLEGEKSCTKKGIAGRAIEYDTLGNLSKATYFDLNGLPTLNEEFWASSVDVLDNNGNIMEEMFFGSDGEPCSSNEGYAKWTAKYDGRGNRIEVAYYGTDGKPCLSNDGYAKGSAKYDNRGNMIEAAFNGTNGEPCMNNYGSAKWIAKHDDHGNVIESSYYGTNGEPCLSNDGYAKWTAKYDDRGNMIEKVYYGTNGEPCLSKDGYAKWTAIYDDRGNMIEVAYYGTDGEPCLHNFGCAKRTAKHDDQGNMIEEAYYGTDGEPCLRNKGYAKRAAKHDDRGNLVEEVYYGTDGEPCLNNDGYGKWTIKYDDRRKWIEQAYFGTDGKPCLNNKGFARRIAKYDGRGNRVEEACYGIDGEPCLNNEGFAKVTAKYDGRRNMIEEAYFGIEGEPIDPFGYYKWSLFNEFGHRTFTYYDKNNQSIEEFSLAWKVSFVYSGGFAQFHNLPIGSIIIQVSEWIVGESLEKASDQFNRRFNKDFYFVTPDEEIVHIQFEYGELGVSMVDFLVEKDQVEQWKAMLEEWKKANE